MSNVSTQESAQSEVDQLRLQLARLQDQLVRQERLTSVGLLLSDIAHEIYNPLAWVKLNNGMLRMMIEQAPASGDAAFVQRLAKFTELLRDNEEGLTRIQHVVDALRLMSRSHSEVKGDEDVNVLCQKTIIMLGGAFKKKGVTVVGDYGALPPIHCNGNDVAQAIMNLLVNANEAVGVHGHVWLVTRVEGSEAFLEVHDDGPGVRIEDRERIFEAFYTTKPLGTGLGLPLVASVAQNHGGRIELLDRPGGGALFRLVLPVKCA